MISIIAFTFLLIFNRVSSQDANCDFVQNIQANKIYYLYSPNHPRNYTPGVQCRWIVSCPTGYNCRLDCSEINLPQSPSCSIDRFLVSKTGDPQLTAAETYCGLGSLTAVSLAQRLSIGLITSRFSPGGRFTCTVVAQPAAPIPSPCSCGERKQTRIVGGENTGVNEFKMMVGLVDIGILQIKCGGVIIASRYVLTAAHCLDIQRPSNMAVIVGEHDVTVGDSPATRAYKVARFIIHPKYNPSTYDYDIGIVVVLEDIQFNEIVGPACLPFKFVNRNMTGSTLTILGWGTIFPGGPTSNVLQKVDVDVISQNTCRARVPNITSRQICTYSLGKDACQDDSGGPLLYTDPDTGRLFNMGIVSYGRLCASKGEPGINTRVTALLSWIVNVTQTNYCIK